jgi:hypothetical protein
MAGREDTHRASPTWWIALAVAACTPRVEPKSEPEEAGAIAVAPPIASSAPTTGPTPAPSVSVPRPVAARSEDASASFCRIVRGPIELPVRGPAVLVPRGDRIDAVLDENGRPRVASFVVGPVSSTSGPLAREVIDGGSASAFKIPCAVAGDAAFCPDRAGAIHRTTLTGEGDRVVASSRTGTRVAAGLVGGAHVLLAYLASRKTSEGWVSEAWGEVDDDPPQRLSEDGSGATAVDVAPRGQELIALTIDARAALTAMHARSVGYERGLRLGEDSVLFVGGPGDRQTAAVLALPQTGPGWALLPIAKDVSEFGLALVRLDDPPRVDEPVVWSMYPNGLDPASIAATMGNGRRWVARVRPRDATPAAARDLELGEVTPEGTFTPRQVVTTADSPGEIGLALDARGVLWLSWLDASGSWIERLACR